MPYEDRSVQPMTHGELTDLPVSFPLETANRAIGMGRTQGYALAKRGEYPVRVLRHGAQYRVTRYDLFAYLGLVVAGEISAQQESA